MRIRIRENSANSISTAVHPVPTSAARSASPAKVGTGRETVDHVGVEIHPQKGPMLQERSA